MDYETTNRFWDDAGHCGRHHDGLPSTLDIFHPGTTIDKTSFNTIPARGIPLTVDVKGNHGWSTAPATVDWVTFPEISITGDETILVQIDVAANYGAARSTDLIFRSTDGTVSRTLKLTQLGSERVEFSEAEMYCDPWEYDIETGQFELYFYGEGDDGIYELYLESFADHYENYLEAELAEEEYHYADTYAKFTFNGESCFTIRGEDGEDNTRAITDGRFTLTQEASGWRVEGSFVLFGGSMLIFDYEGDVLNQYEVALTEDVEVDFAGFKSKDIYAEQVEDGLWVLNMWIETSVTQEVVLLSINTEKGSGTLPTDTFPMADGIGLGVAGTAEPFYVYEDWEAECGWAKYSESGGRQFTYAVPGEGFVSIGKEGETYTIGFSFVDPNGHTVSGEYVGQNLDIYNPDGTRARTRSLPVRRLAPRR